MYFKVSQSYTQLRAMSICICVAVKSPSSPLHSTLKQDRPTASTDQSRLGHTNLMFCFASTAGQFSGKVIYKCKFVGVALVSRDSLIPRLTGTRRVTRDTALVHVFLNMATRTRTQVWISAEVLLIHTWVRVR